MFTIRRYQSHCITSVCNVVAVSMWIYLFEYIHYHKYALYIVDIHVLYYT